MGSTMDMNDKKSRDRKRQIMNSKTILNQRSKMGRCQENREMDDRKIRILARRKHQMSKNEKSRIMKIKEEKTKINQNNETVGKRKKKMMRCHKYKMMTNRKN